MTRRYGRRRERTVTSPSRFMDPKKGNRVRIGKQTASQRESNKQKLYSRIWDREKRNSDHNSRLTDTSYPGGYQPSKYSLKSSNLHIQRGDAIFPGGMVYPDSNSSEESMNMTDRDSDSSNSSDADSDMDILQSHQENDALLPNTIGPSVHLIQNLSERDLTKTKLVSIAENAMEQELSFDDSVEGDSNVTTDEQLENSKHSIMASGADAEEIASSSDIEREYTKRYHLPKTLPEKELLAHCEPYLDIVEDLLAGKFVSLYYNQGKRAFMESKSAILSTEEFRKLDINRYVAGYYGLRRQIRIGELVLERFRDKLLTSRSPMLKWWGGATDFANYIIAPEILLSLCIEEMGLKDDESASEGQDNIELREKAFEIFRKTVLFGLRVADELWET